MTDAGRVQAAREALYSEAILAKSQRSVVTATLAGADAVAAWQHYPAGDAFDPASGAQHYYHCHPPQAGDAEHGHFHLFLRPDGAQGPIHHLIALGMDAHGRLRRLFAVNRWVTGDDWRDAETLIALVPRFDVQLAVPDFLVNRWLTAVVALYADDIAELLRARDAALAARGGAPELLEDRGLEVLSERAVDLHDTARRLGLQAAGQ